MRKPQLTILLLLLSVATWSQNFTFSPQKPKPGDLITFNYEPVGLLVGKGKPIACAFYQLKKAGSGAIGHVSADELNLVKQGNKYSGSLQTDTAANFIYFGFSSGSDYDNNKNEGYYILLTDGEKPCRGAYYAQAMFYNHMGRSVGLDRNTDKAVDAIEKEITLYPEDRKDYIFNYLSSASRASKEGVSALIQKEIEATLKKGLTTEADYNMLAYLYEMSKLPEQAKFMETLKKEKFPNGAWQVSDFMIKFYREQDPELIRSMAKEAEEKIRTDSNWKAYKCALPDIKGRSLYTYKDKKEWDKLKQAIQEMKEVSDGVYGTFNNMAWGMQGNGDNLPLAEELSRKATEYARKEWKQPTEKKPPHMTSKEWERSLHSRYGMYADTYAMVLYRMGEYKKGFSYAKEVAMDMNNGKAANLNTTYALLAEKVLPLKQYKKQMEDFVRQGRSGKEVKEVLQRAYTKEKGSEEGFESYMAALEKEEQLRKLEKIRKSILNVPAPSFTLQDLDGKQVSLTDLKGKTIVLDFWATWCGPCIQSFPGMQKAVSKFRNDPDVVFLFVDTWESGEDKKKNAADFIASKKLDFLVLMDIENKVVEQFKVEGIPTKFIIDKEGTIRFKSVGFNGDDDHLVQELSAMIEIANNLARKEL